MNSSSKVSPNGNRPLPTGYEYGVDDDPEAHSSSPQLWFFFDRAFEAMVVFHAEDDVVLAANDAYLELTGYERHKVIGRTGIELGLWSQTEDRRATIDAMRGGEFDGAELVFPTKSGDIRLIEAHRPDPRLRARRGRGRRAGRAGQAPDARLAARGRRGRPQAWGGARRGDEHR
jgi:PAS domain S-box-containing protein